MIAAGCFLVGALVGALVMRYRVGAELYGLRVERSNALEEAQHWRGRWAMERRR